MPFCRFCSLSYIPLRKVPIFHISKFGRCAELKSLIDASPLGRNNGELRGSCGGRCCKEVARVMAEVDAEGVDGGRDDSNPRQRAPIGFPISPFYLYPNLLKFPIWPPRRAKVELPMEELELWAAEKH
ncbi:hypothetical protein SESBI_11439 [Sesbania bispinosa]|nr:hypothetical protein SESBI_11439 [Sesbania bispinosa]